MDASTKINIPESANERIVIVGGGFGGLQMARKLSRDNYQVVLIDKNNSVTNASRSTPCR